MAYATSLSDGLHHKLRFKAEHAEQEYACHWKTSQAKGVANAILLHHITITR